MSDGPIVIKFGGSLLEDKKKRTVFLTQLALEWNIQRSKIILVHGGGKDITRALESKGIPPKFIDGRRFTDMATMLVVEQVLGEINHGIVEELKNNGAQAWGGSGKSNDIMRASPLPNLGFVGGAPFSINKTAFSKILESAKLPVFYSIARGPASETMNINADDFAQELAIASGARELIFLTDTGGVLDKSGKLILQINPLGADRLVTDGTITGGMAVKIQASLHAVHQGVKKVIIGESVLSNAQALHVTKGTAVIKEGPTILDGSPASGRGG